MKLEKMVPLIHKTLHAAKPKNVNNDHVEYTMDLIKAVLKKVDSIC